MTSLLQKMQQGAVSRPSVPSKPTLRRTVICRAQKETTVQTWGQKAAAAAAAAMLAAGTMSGAAIASEFDILGEPTPTTQYYFDDANVLSKSTRSELNKKLKILEINSGYRVNIATVRKLEFEPDAFAFADKVLESWYPTPEQGDKKGVVLLVTSAKEGAISGGSSFLAALGDDLLDSLINDNIPIYSEQERYNMTMESVVERIEAKLNGQPVPDAPQREDKTRKRNYKTKEETDQSKPVTGSIVVTLLIIAVVVPMLQYYGYTSKD